MQGFLRHFRGTLEDLNVRGKVILKTPFSVLFITGPAIATSRTCCPKWRRPSSTA